MSHYKTYMSHYKKRGESKMATIPLTSWQPHQTTKKTRKSQLEAIKRY